MKVTDVKKLVNQYITKTALIATVGILLFVGGCSVYNLRSKLNLTRVELQSTSLLYSIVEKEKHRLDSLVIDYNDKIIKRDGLIREQTKVIAKQDKYIASLQDSLKEDLQDVMAVNADSSYKYINTRVKPLSERKYGLDSMQIKNIHYTYIERDGLFKINLGLDTLVKDLKLLSSTKDNQIVELNSLVNVYKSQGDLYKRENEAYVVEITGLNKSVTQQKRLKNIMSGVVVGTVSYIIINSLTK